MESSDNSKEVGLLDRLRNMWEFASIMQYIFLFGKAVKIDDTFDIGVILPHSCYPFRPSPPPRPGCSDQGTV
jgi:hypothetical protein